MRAFFYLDFFRFSGPLCWKRCGVTKYAKCDLCTYISIFNDLSEFAIYSIRYLSYKENKIKSDYQHLLSCLKTNLNPLSPLNIFGPGLKRFSFCPSNEFELKVRWKGCDLARKKFSKNETREIKWLNFCLFTLTTYRNWCVSCHNTCSTT